MVSGFVYKREGLLFMPNAKRKVKRPKTKMMLVAPPTHLPPLQTSPTVQAFPSEQGAVLLVWTHPVAGWQESSVHTLPSSQVGGGPPLDASSWPSTRKSAKRHAGREPHLDS